MPHAYTEDQLVEQPAIGLFAALGWQTVSAMEETFGDRERSAARPRARWCWSIARAQRSSGSTLSFRPRRSTPPSTS